MIKPTVGRVVWFMRSQQEVQPMAAMVAYVIDDTHVNLAAFTHEGANFPALGVLLLQDDAAPPEQGPYCQWMPYQLGQAAKTEQVAKELADLTLSRNAQKGRLPPLDPLPTLTDVIPTEQDDGRPDPGK